MHPHTLQVQPYTLWVCRLRMHDSCALVVWQHAPRGKETETQAAAATAQFNIQSPHSRDATLAPYRTPQVRSASACGVRCIPSHRYWLQRNTTHTGGQPKVASTSTHDMEAACQAPATHSTYCVVTESTHVQQSLCIDHQQSWAISVITITGVVTGVVTITDVSHASYTHRPLTNHIRQCLPFIVAKRGAHPTNSCHLGAYRKWQALFTCPSGGVGAQEGQREADESTLNKDAASADAQSSCHSGSTVGLSHIYRAPSSILSQC